MTAATGPKGQGVNLDRCSDAAEHVLGDIAYGPAGKKYRYVQFLDAVTYATGHSVCLASATDWKVTNDRAGGSGLANQFPVGVIHQATANVPTQNQYGWVQISGIATIVAGSAAIIAGDTLKPDATADGLTDEGTNGTDENIVGVALDTIADNASGLCMLAIRGA